MEREQKKELWGIMMVTLAGISVIGCMALPNVLLNGENILGLKFMGVLILIQGLITILILGEILPNNPEVDERLLLNALNMLFSLIYLATIAAIWSSLAGLSEINTWNIIYGGIWVTIYPFIAVVKTAVDLELMHKEDI